VPTQESLKGKTWIAASSRDQRFINVAGISSPGLSAAPAIAHEVIKLIKAQLLSSRVTIEGQYRTRRVPHDFFCRAPEHIVLQTL
jgi:L-2-hydroxyglutarate oxidase LhgO